MTLTILGALALALVIASLITVARVTARRRNDARSDAYWAARQYEESAEVALFMNNKR